ncbi:neuromedin-U isoform X2 [Melanotaenia boesemani]|uniref:neuromedin-U isoform X2 n=1 Tax=Melanotaenia boesemani TaxID=1250792 RepID=UPI001C044C6A|nr:neuromedin-U isoform X2 [Melanotaenia boesemani]
MTTPRASVEGVCRKPSYFCDVRKCQKSLKEKKKKIIKRDKGQPGREMKTFQSQSQPAQRGAPSNLHSLSSSAMSLLSPASITLTALLILTIPACTGAPADIQQATTDQRQLHLQIDSVCSSYPSADLNSWASDVLGELCVLMLVQKSKELRVQENSKRAELQGPGGIESRGYFLYRPRNGRRSLEYE